MIKNAKNIECFSVSYNYGVTICKPCLEKSSNDSNKIYQLFARIPYNSYFRIYLKILYRWIQARHLSWGSTSGNLHAVSHQLFQNSSTTVFFWVRQIFSELSKKKKKLLVNISENIKQKIYAGTTEKGQRDKSCNGTAKEIKVNHCEKSTVEISTIFWNSFVLMVF